VLSYTRTFCLEVVVIKPGATRLQRVCVLPIKQTDKYKTGTKF